MFLPSQSSEFIELILPRVRRKLLNPKSSIFNTQRLSITQLDDFKLPWYFISVFCKYVIPCNKKDSNIYVHTDMKIDFHHKLKVFSHLSMRIEEPNVEQLLFTILLTHTTYMEMTGVYTTTVKYTVESISRKSCNYNTL